MKYIVADTLGQEVEIQASNEGVYLAINDIVAELTPPQVKEIQFALNRARETAEKNIQERGRR